MYKHAVSASIASLLMPAVIGFAGPAAAAPTALEMPDVKGMSLAKADEAIATLSPGTTFRLITHNVGGYPQLQLSPAQWAVCGQWPAATTQITKKTKIELWVKRPWIGC